MTAEVVELFGAPLTDIPGMLHQVADSIANGDYGEVGAAFLVIPRHGEAPTVFGWGDVEDGNHPIIQFELAKTWLLTNMVGRI